jgi:hypothetical protein
MPFAKNICISNIPSNLKSIGTIPHVRNIGLTEAQNQGLANRMGSRYHVCPLARYRVADFPAIDVGIGGMGYLQRWTSSGVIANYRRIHILDRLKRIIPLDLYNCDIGAFADMERGCCVLSNLPCCIGGIPGGEGSTYGSDCASLGRFVYARSNAGIHSYDDKSQNGDCYANPVTISPYVDRTFINHLSRLVLAIPLGFIGFGFIQSAGYVEDISVVNVAKLLIGVIFIAAIFVVIHGVSSLIEGRKHWGTLSGW